TEEKAARCRELGAHHVLFYAEATAERIRELSDGGVAVVFDGVGADTFDTSLASLRPRGMLVLFGAASGPVPAVDPQRLNSAGSVFLTRPTLAHYIATTEEYRARAAEVMEGLLDGSLRLSVGATVGADDAAEAPRSRQSRQTTGSVVLDPARCGGAGSRPAPLTNRPAVVDSTQGSISEMVWSPSTASTERATNTP